MRHAYLIMAHNKFEQLGKLIECLDSKQNDIFLHIDANANFDISDMCYVPCYSGLYFVPRAKINWGGYSQVQAELNLIEKALTTDSYGFYHLLTGLDMPLKPINEINQFYKQNSGKQFISLEETVPNYVFDRIRYYYPFQELFDRNSKIGNGVRKVVLLIQKILGINRIPEKMNLGYGSAYFDITGEFASYLVEKKADIDNIYSSTFCADEIFLQTIFLNSPFCMDSGRFEYKGISTWVDRSYMDICRAIDWKRGTPYTYCDSDFNDLVNSGCMFARKIDMEKSPELFQKLIFNTRK